MFLCIKIQNTPNNILLQNMKLIMYDAIQKSKKNFKKY